MVFLTLYTRDTVQCFAKKPTDWTHTLKKDARGSAEILVPNAKLHGVASKKANLLLNIHIQNRSLRYGLNINSVNNPKSPATAISTTSCCQKSSGSHCSVFGRSVTHEAHSISADRRPMQWPPASSHAVSRRTSRNMDFIISSSDLVRMLGNALGYSGPVWFGGQTQLRHSSICVKCMYTC